MGADYYTGLLDPTYEGRRWIVVADTVAGAAAPARRMIDGGAAAVMVVAGSEGTGPPPPAGVPVFVAGTGGSTLLEAIRAYAAALTDPSRELCAAVDVFDPGGAATVVTGYVIPSGELCGRPVYGGSRPEWKALEDKLIVDELWDRAGVGRAPSAIVAADAASIEQAVAAVAGADGAVLVADNSEGWHGGGEYTRFLAPGADDSHTLRFFREHAQRVRVMPFLSGVPCAIHGLVTGDAVLAFRPVELLVFRPAGSDEFLYGGVATVWDPPAVVREEMRRAARSVGAILGREVGYRGAFGIDGVCTDRGFLPTELNPRLSPGLGIQAEAAGGYPMSDIDRAVIAGLDVDLRLDRLEDEIVAGADGNRAGSWSRPVPHLAVTGTTEQPIAYDGSSWRPVDEGEATATMSLGPAPQGAAVRVKLAEGHGLPAGPSLAATAAASLRLADELWGTRIGDLLPGG